jgi:hypothetical protein
VGGTAGDPSRLAIGTNGHVLKVSSGTPAWAAESATAIDTQLGFVGRPVNSETDYVVIGRACKFLRGNPSSNALSGRAYARSWAAATTTFELRKNGTRIEDIQFTVANGSVGNFAGNVADTDVTFAAGDILELVAPATSDATLANIRVAVRLEVT